MDNERGLPGVLRRVPDFPGNRLFLLPMYSGGQRWGFFASGSARSKPRRTPQRSTPTQPSPWVQGEGNKRRSRMDLHSPGKSGTLVRSGSPPAESGVIARWARLGAYETRPGRARFRLFHDKFELFRRFWVRVWEQCSGETALSGRETGRRQRGTRGGFDGKLNPASQLKEISATEPARNTGHEPHGAPGPPKFSPCVRQ
jgi:hypothetical protein